MKITEKMIRQYFNKSVKLKKKYKKFINQRMDELFGLYCDTANYGRDGIMFVPLYNDDSEDMPKTVIMYDQLMKLINSDQKGFDKKDGVFQQLDAWDKEHAQSLMNTYLSNGGMLH